MPRSTNRVPSRRRRKRLLKRAKGYVGAASKQIRTAKAAILRAGQYAYRDRRNRRREFRRLWILRISAAVRARGMTYSQFIDGLNRANVDLNRKVLAALAIEEPATFDALVDKARAAREAA
jgi:large subunit ribosomal protein L20